MDLLPEEPSVVHRRPSRQSVEDHSHHPLSQKYESLDYELCENQLYKRDELLPFHQLVLCRQSVNRWFICFLIGVLTAFVACFIDILLHYVTRLKFDMVLRGLFVWGSETNRLYVPLAAWVGFNCAFVLVAAVLVVYVAGSVASGSGIPQIKCFLNGVMIPGVVRAKTLLAKAVGVAFSVGGGLSVGKEGPMIHSGAVVAAGISQGRCVSLPFDFKVFEYFRNDRDKRDFVSAGAAAGVAAAFGAPIGGVLFSLEEGASFWNQSLTWRLFFSSMISSFTLSVVLSTFHGKAGMLSWSGLANFGTFKSMEYNWWEIPLFLLIGALGGLSGALFNHLNYRLTLFRMHFVKHAWQKVAEALIIAAVSAMVAFATIYLVDDCQPIGVFPNITEPVQLWCPNGYYSAVVEIYFHSPEEAVKALFHSPSNAIRPATLAVFAVGYFLLSTWTYGLQVPSGLFIPTLLTGAAWGRLIGLLVHFLFPDVAGLDPGKYALAGAAAQLGGVVRMTISLCAIIIEATRDITFGLPIMLILMMAKWVGDAFNEGLYDIHIELAEVPILGWEAPTPSSNILASQVMRSNVVVLQAVERVGKVMRVLKSDGHHGYPVVDERASLAGVGYGRLKGLVLRSQLITLLRHRHFSKDRAALEMADGWMPVTTRDFRDAYPRYDVRLDSLSLDADDLDGWLDLRPFFNPSPHRVPFGASLTSCFQLFRGLGLRYLVVVDHDNMVRGMITRKDLARYRQIRHGQSFSVKELYISET